MNIKLFCLKFLVIVFISKKGCVYMKYLHIRLNELLEQHNISKNRICKDLDQQRGNFNRYCRDDFQRVDANLIIKLCEYFQCDVGDLFEIREREE